MTRPPVEEPGGPDVIEFATSSKWLGKDYLSISQVAVLKAIYGLELDAQEFRALMDMTEGRPVRSQGYQKAALVIGTRGGKSDIIAVVGTYEAVRWGPQIGNFLIPGQVAVGIIIASDKVQARVVRGYVEGNLSRLEENGFPCLAQFASGQQKAVTGTEIKLAWPIEIRIYPANAYSVRGATGLFFIGDEIAHWDVSEGAFNQDKKVMSAARTRFGTLAHLRPKRIILSSPAEKRGVLWDTYKKCRDGADKTTLAVKAPTWVFNPVYATDPEQIEFLNEEMEDDPEAFAMNYGAEFAEVGAGESAYLPAHTIDPCVARGISLRLPKPGTEHVGWIDPAFSQDRFSFGIAHAEFDDAGVMKAVFDLTKHWTPKRNGPPLDDDAILEEIARDCTAYGIPTLNTDQFSEVVLRSKFRDLGISLVCTPATNAEKHDAFKNLRQALAAARVSLLDDDVMIRDLKGLVKKQTQGGHVWIGAPKGRRGAYDDAATVASRLVMKLLPLSSGIDIAKLNAGGSLVPDPNRRLDWQAFDHPSSGNDLDDAFRPIWDQVM